jgi:ABC-2 type transport system ATP-binding protein
MLKINNLSKKFSGNDFYSLKDVSLEIKKGEIVGLIGKNGAGKSTLMKLMAKSLKPSKGNIAYNGVDIYSQDNILADFGIMIDPVFYPDMTVMENVKFYLRLHDKENMFFNIEPTLKLVELWDERNRKPRDFSFGMKQRTALAIAMVAEPNFLLLDEPFVGLDPIGVQKLITILKRWSSERQISMLISSHQLGELEELCERYLYIDNGCLANAREGSRKPGIIIHLDTKKDIEMMLPLQNDSIRLVDNRLEIVVGDATDDLHAVFEVLGKNKLISSLEMKENHLKELFMEG